LCMWENEWVDAHTETLAERQAHAVSVLQQSQSWPGMAETPYAHISANMADAAVRGDAPAVTEASLPLFCSAVDEALAP
ncbi:MAG TPA: hypothetical protein VGP24_15010, partial [Glaciihabitans sp.]|nr:hypothetical protein [Glaciihabitans sp.]